MNPGTIILDALEDGDTLLSLCCGIGFELKNATDSSLSGIDITAVDIVPEYIAVFAERYPHATTIISDAVTYITRANDDSFDVISIIDGLEHLTKKKGWKLLEECKRVARNKVFIFTPEGYIKNEPKNSWDIEAGDKYQIHLSGWTIDELVSVGYKLLRQHPAVSILGDAYNETMYLYEKNP